MTNQTNYNKSFVLHVDSLDVLNELSDQQAGKLFKSIYQYQKTGKYTKLDQLLTIIINPLICQFKRDEEKYHNSIVKGKLGNLKKYHKKIYQQVIEGKMTLENAENLAYPEKLIKSTICRPPITPDSQGSYNVNDNVNINTNDNKNDNKNKNESKSDNKNELEDNFERIYKLYNSDKKIKVIPFDKLKNQFKAALSKVSITELEENVLAYLAYLKTALWRKKKDFAAWINSSEFYANDWLAEIKQENNQIATQSNKFESLTLFVNNLIGHTLIESISVSPSNKAVLKFKSKTEFDKFVSLEENFKNQAKKKISEELGTNGFEPKY